MADALGLRSCRGRKAPLALLVCETGQAGLGRRCAEPPAPPCPASSMNRRAAGALGRVISMNRQFICVWSVCGRPLIPHSFDCPCESAVHHRQPHRCRTARINCSNADASRVSVWMKRMISRFVMGSSLFCPRGNRVDGRFFTPSAKRAEQSRKPRSGPMLHTPSGTEARSLVPPARTARPTATNASPRQTEELTQNQHAVRPQNLGHPS